MNRPFVWLIFSALFSSPPAAGYVRLKGATGTFLYRPDFAGVQLVLSDKTVPGMGNAANFLWITPDSDVVGAVQGAMAAWNGVQTSSARFSPLQIASATSSVQGRNVVIFLDTPAIRSAIGPSTLAQTDISYAVGGASDGGIAWSFTYMNPAFTFSTTGVPNTVDLQAVLTHEFGHALGANHTGSIGSTMFQNESPNSTSWRNLTPDDVAFASNVYPSGSSSAIYGGVAGTLSMVGNPVRNALVNAMDTTSGTVFSALTSSLDGTYLIPAPPGSYYLLVEPIVGDINYNFYLGALDAIDSGFPTGFASAGGAPAVLQVAAGANTNGDFSPPTTTSSISLQYISSAPGAGGFPDWKTINSVGGALQLPSGGTIDLLVAGTGLDTTLTDANINLLGPLTLQPGTIRWDASLSNGLKVMRMTVNVASVPVTTTATLIISQNGSTAAFAGGLVLLAAPAP